MRKRLRTEAEGGTLSARTVQSASTDHGDPALVRSVIRRPPKACHVVTAGIAANASAIVTWHARDFPALRVPLGPDFGPLAQRCQPLLREAQQAAPQKRVFNALIDLRAAGFELVVPDFRETFLLYRFRATNARGVDCVVEIGGPGTIVMSLGVGRGRTSQPDRREPLEVGGGPRSFIVDRPRNYARCDQRRKSGRFRGDEPGNCDAPLAPRDRSGVPVCRGEGGIPPFRRSRAFRQSRNHTRLRSDRLAGPRDQRFESASLQRRVCCGMTLVPVEPFDCQDSGSARAFHACARISASGNHRAVGAGWIITR
jgi:hypothetical protein